jgi:hypothetical protein
MATKLSKKQKEKIMKQYSGRMPTQEEVMEKIKASQERLMQALAGMARTAPDDPEIKTEIMKAIEKAADLRKRIYKEVVKEEVPRIHEEGEEVN